MLALLPSKKIPRLLWACGGGAALALCFPNFSLLPLLPVALIPLLFSVSGLPWRNAFLPGWIFGSAFWLVSIPWIAYTVNRFGGVGPILAGLALAITAGVYAIPFGLMASAYAALRPKTPFGIVLGFAAAWVSQEAFRTHVFVFGGFPWNLLAHPLADVPALLGTTALGGVLLTSFVLAALNAALFVALTREAREARLGWLVSALAAAFAFAAALPMRAPTLGEALKVGVVQPNVEQDVRWDAGTAERILSDLEEQTRGLCRADRPAVVLWPESSSPFAWPFSGAYRARVLRLAKELDVVILLNTIWSDAPGEENAPFYNGALLVTKDGPSLPPYRKQRLVPFGEYVPLAPLLRMIKPISRAVPGGFTPGEGTVLLNLGSWKLGGAICYEVVYPWIARREVRMGADLLFTLTNDAWYGRAGAQRQHWQAAVLRAVETGRPLVRAAITGISGAIGPDGRVIVSIPPGKKGAFAAPLFRPGAPPPAVALGETVAWVCALGLLAGILRARFSSPR